MPGLAYKAQSAPLQARSELTNQMTKASTHTLIDGSVDEWLSAQLAQGADFSPPATQADAQINVLTRTLAQAAQALLDQQNKDGHWRFDLEADATIPAEYMLLQHLLGTVDEAREKRLADYLISRQLDDGSWPLYYAGPGNISATVKSYFALKMAGTDPASQVMQRAHDWVHQHGGAEASNVFTRILLAMFGQLPWRTVPAMPPEIIWLPGWFIFSLSKVSYWSRCVIVPLLLIFAHKPVFAVPEGKTIRELFSRDPNTLKHLDKFTPGQPAKNLFLLVDRCLKRIDPWVPGVIRRHAVKALERWTREHMRGAGGIGAIYPAMANAVYALHLQGAGPTDPDRIRGIQAIEDLVIDDAGAEESYVQPCLSPVWDTCLSLSALSEAGLAIDHQAVQTAIRWLFARQVVVRGDWSDKAPTLDSGGWAFQYENDFYPDLDDTSMVVMALLRADAHKDPDRLKRMAMAVNWVLGMQGSDGGWGAFDIDNHYDYLNNIPFADHGALVDPGTADLTGRCIEMLAMFGFDKSFPPISRGIEFLRQDQADDGAWFGRWGVNYIYGTWAALVGLAAIGEDPNHACIRKAVHWLEQVQNSDGGWGEDCTSYNDSALAGRGKSTPSQTAWGLLGLMAAGEHESEAVARGVQYLLRHYRDDRNSAGGWFESLYTGTGFPRVFYLRYHGYSHYFPVWALGVYRRLTQGQPSRQDILIRQSQGIDPALLPVLSNPDYLARFR